MIVKYKKLFPIGPYLNEEIGFEYEIANVSDAENAVNALRSMAEDYHKKRYPEMYLENAIQPADNVQVPVQQVEVVSTENEVEAIANAKDLKELGTFKAISKKTAEHNAAYMKRLAELAS
jgi:hypothetical protein